MTKHRISLIATVLNEGESIDRLLASIAAQTRQPDEIIIVDGGSHDDTVARLQSHTDTLPLTALQAPGCNISQGRNTALEHVTGDILVVTDAGVRLANDWLEVLVQPLLDDPALGVAAGFFEADPYTVFEAAMGATVLPLADEIDSATFLPSSRSIALRTALARQVQGYPAWLDYCEDLIFDLRLKLLKVPFAFVREAVAHFQPRGSLRAFYKQYYLYARGDGKADLWRKRHAIRYITYLVALPLGLYLSLFVHPAFWLLLLLGGIVYLRQPYRRLPTAMQRAPRRDIAAWAYAIALIPIIRVVGDVAKMIGYPAGWRWRLANNPPDWRAVPERAPATR
ncbi:glycosyltransferase [Phototrophicus methaneseepsis]|uniref:Glycosyltransferase n=1 Tax=Phototrophicus methaneseepsis TaxID=2710758 RepID=A0A7S8IEC7_9CHLR|nr:glycosyltransferase [Phototrophicus methaneseepsis]QPC83520.1 glycosyltransferase [Phototrophicus methaneseepsis]